jgi:transcriptional regulator with XRE-family HTH domain
MPRRPGPASFARGIGRRIRAFRLEAGLTQERFAWDCEVDKSHMSMIESGKRMPSLPMLLVIAKELHVQVADLVGYDLEEPRMGLLDAIRRKDKETAAKLLKRLGMA